MNRMMGALRATMHLVLSSVEGKDQALVWVGPKVMVLPVREGCHR